MAALVPMEQAATRVRHRSSVSTTHRTYSGDVLIAMGQGYQDVIILKVDPGGQFELDADSV